MIRVVTPPITPAIACLTGALLGALVSGLLFLVDGLFDSVDGRCLVESWWTLPDVQRDRAAFLVAVAAQEPRWKEQRNEINKLLNNLQTAEWMVGTPQRRRGWATSRPDVAA